EDNNVKNRRNWLQATAGVAAVIVLALGAASPAWACNGDHIKNGCDSSLFVPLSGVFFEPPDPCVTAGENVSLTGMVHVVTHEIGTGAGTGKVDIHLNMAGVTGTGQTTGTMYIGEGSNKFIDVPITLGSTDLIQATFSLEPTNRCASVPLPLSFNLVFGSDGTLLPSSTVMVTPPPTSTAKVQALHR
ncbi:MAG: hypothetical protein ACREDJ_10540, partial [Methylocella sp.]